MSTAVAVPVQGHLPMASFEQHADSLASAIATLWGQVEEAGITAKEMYQLLQQPQVKSMTIGALQVLDPQRPDAKRKRPLTVLRVQQDGGEWNRTLLMVAIDLVQKHGYVAAVMRNGNGENGQLENRLLVFADPPTF